MNIATEAIFELDHFSSVLSMVSDSLTIILESLEDELQSAKKSQFGATNLRKEVNCICLR